MRQKRERERRFINNSTTTNQLSTIILIALSVECMQPINMSIEISENRIFQVPISVPEKVDPANMLIALRDWLSTKTDMYSLSCKSINVDVYPVVKYNFYKDIHDNSSYKINHTL